MWSEHIGAVGVRAVTPTVFLLVQSLNNVRVGSAFVWLVVLRVLKKNFIHVCASILEQFVGAVEDNQSNFAVAENA